MSSSLLPSHPHPPPPPPPPLSPPSVVLPNAHLVVVARDRPQHPHVTPIAAPSLPSPSPSLPNSPTTTTSSSATTLTSTTSTTTTPPPPTTSTKASTTTTTTNTNAVTPTVKPTGTDTTATATTTSTSTTSSSSTSSSRPALPSPITASAIAPTVVGNPTTSTNTTTGSAAATTTTGAVATTNSSSTSTRPKTFMCTVPGCRKPFSKKWNMQAHMRLHTGSTPFACRLGCGASYMWMSSRKGHELNRCRFAAFIPPELNPSRRPSRYRRSMSGNAVSPIAAAAAAAVVAGGGGVTATTTATTTTAATTANATATASSSGIVDGNNLGMEPQTSSVLVGNAAAVDRHNQMRQGHPDATRTDGGMNTNGKFDTDATAVGHNATDTAATATTATTDRLTSSTVGDVTAAMPQALLLQQQQQNQQHVDLGQQPNYQQPNYQQQQLQQPQLPSYQHQAYHDGQFETQARLPLQPQPHPHPQAYNNTINATSAAGAARHAVLANTNNNQVNLDHQQRFRHEGHAPITLATSRIGPPSPSSSTAPAAVVLPPALQNLQLYNRCESMSVNRELSATTTATAAAGVANGLMALPVSPVSPNSVATGGAVMTDGMGSSDRHQQDMMMMMIMMNMQEQQQRHHQQQQHQHHQQKYQQHQQQQQQVQHHQKYQQQHQQQSLSLSSQALLPATIGAAGSEGNINGLIPCDNKTQMPPMTQQVKHEQTEGQRLAKQQQREAATSSYPASSDRRQALESRVRATSSAWMKAALEATAVQLMKSGTNSSVSSGVVKQEPVCAGAVRHGNVNDNSRHAVLKRDDKRVRVEEGDRNREEGNVAVIKVDDIQQRLDDNVDMDMDMDMEMEIGGGDLGLGLGMGLCGMGMDMGVMVDKEKDQDGDGSSQVSDVTCSDAPDAQQQQQHKRGRDEAGDSERNDSDCNKKNKALRPRADTKTRTSSGCGRHGGRRRMMEEERRWGVGTLDVNSRTSRWVLGGEVGTTTRRSGDAAAATGGLDVLADVDLPDRDGFSEEFLEHLLC